eukprot:CAMPEP_0171237204 /NCGR_PEP_ID=MMETSP0790-20130122/42850_1 /TAXON_ID=2925 /ORGANISM="Alexandrium catenella, Strain OF101" /LENGTH=259 /DNA_ID=CAMNT_0011703557 /DNA_START=24 /DNA_END=799 /DNA_ORIENTATION=-
MERLARIAKHVNAEGSQRPLPLSPVQTASSSPIVASLKAKIGALAQERSALKAELLKSGEVKLQEVTVDMAINGARSIKTMVTETSDLDANDGIFYRGRSLFDVNKILPKAPGGETGLPEAAFWLLLTGEVPSSEECRAFTEELHRRSTVPPNVYVTIDTLPTSVHPMTQLATGMLAMQKDSAFTSQYNAGMKKNEYWEWALEDALDLVARIPVVAAYIYRRTFKDGKVPAYNSRLDWAANYAQMLGVNDSEEFKECTR